MAEVQEVPNTKPYTKEVQALGGLLPEKDAPVYATAVAAQARVLLTGDHKHFGELMKRDDLPLQVRSVRAFLLEGPERSG
jgi:predicted nucleic acid-binding protein